MTHNKRSISIISLFAASLILFMSYTTLALATEPKPTTHNQQISLNKLMLAQSEGCKDCVRGYDCNVINTRCNKTCEASLFTDDLDLESCRFECIKVWESCNNRAKTACSFYCKE